MPPIFISISRPFLRSKLRLATILPLLKPRTPSRRLGTPPPPSSSPQSRADRIISKLPRYLHPYATPLLHHPTSHLTSFLILHELTAIIPLFTFFYIFQLTSWNPADLLPKEWIENGYTKFKSYIEKKGLQKWVDGRGVMDLATAWAVVKAAMPLRVVVSVWGAPWFARVAVLPFVRLFRRV
ncbi:hypothetical protein TWF281_001786 [Arthrobotrys megalospora]